jgi:lipopolysaccharide transport system permease protein
VTADSASDLSVTVYTPASATAHPGRILRDMFRDIAASRELAWRLFVRDTRSLYRQSIFGYLWAFAPPLATTLTFVYLNSQQIINIGDTRVPYPAFVIIGTLLWQAFADALANPLKTVTAAKAMLTKINFPREALILAGVADVVFNAAVRALLLVPVFLVYKLPLTGSVLLAIPATGALIVIGLALGLLLTPLGLLYGDVGRAIPLVTAFWMLMSPVVYPIPTAGLAGAVARWNPVAPVLQTARDYLIGQPATHALDALVVTAVAVVVLMAALLLYRLGMPILIERMGG